MSTPAEQFGRRVRQSREERGWSQGDLARECGLTPSGVAHFEAGRREPRLTSIVRLAEALDISADYLVGISNQPQASVARSSKIANLVGRMRSEDVEFLEKMAQELALRNR